MKKRKELTPEQKRIAEESRVLVKIIGQLEGLSDRALDEIVAAVNRRRHAQDPAEPPRVRAVDE